VKVSITVARAPRHTFAPARRDVSIDVELNPQSSGPAGLAEAAEVVNTLVSTASFAARRLLEKADRDLQGPVTVNVAGAATPEALRAIVEELGRERAETPQDDPSAEGELPEDDLDAAARRHPGAYTDWPLELLEQECAARGIDATEFVAVEEFAEALQADDEGQALVTDDDADGDA
jgi:hypothetical protein